jgi:hypothetical protein
MDVPSPAPAANGEAPVARLDAGRSRLGATGALLALGPADLASPQALGRALFRPRDAA